MNIHKNHSRVNQEVELKLLISPEEVEQLCQHPLLNQYATTKPYTQELTSTYYDTPDFQIRQHGASLRVRHLESDSVQTLKDDGEGNSGLHRRGEWEGHVDGSLPNLPALHDMLDKHTQLRKMLSNSSLSSQLRPIFDTRVKRTVWELRLPNGEEIEFALDQGSIEHEDLHESISEVELELKAGEPKKLFDFASQLLDDVPMRIGNISKAERGYSLCSPSTDKTAGIKAERIELSEDLSVESAFKAIAVNCLAQIQGNAESVVQSEDPESVHQMRVGMRRLHSALRLFKDIVPFPDSLRKELDWLSSQLGPARDWEVLSASTLSGVENVARDETGLVALHNAVIDVAREKRKQAAEAVQSLRYTKLMLAFSGWLEGAEWRNAMLVSKRRKLDEPVHRFADKMLVEDENRLKRRGK
ncbi:MAG: CYTH and CHAD domain-containing protein, partial [Burkholderiaceae bacterium]